jgi:hypothetical protein
MKSGHAGFFGGISMQGDDCDLHLSARIMSIKLGEIGIALSEGHIIDAFKNFAFKNFRDGKTGLNLGIRVKTGLRRTQKGVEFSVAVRDSWRVEMLYDEPSGIAELTVLACSPEEGGGATWSKHDLPSGSPSFTRIEKTDGPFEGGCDFCYVSREMSFSHGELWDRSLHIPADRGYYSDGSARWEIRYVSNRTAGRDGSPLCRLFWGNGNVMAEEYGDSLIGRHRAAEDGPAYLEYYPNGTVAAKVFAIHGSVIGEPERFYPSGAPKLEDSRRDISGLDDWRNWYATGAGGGGITLNGGISAICDSISSRLAKESLLSSSKGKVAMSLPRHLGSGIDSPTKNPPIVTTIAGAAPTRISSGGQIALPSRL